MKYEINWAHHEFGAKEALEKNLFITIIHGNLTITTCGEEMHK